MIVEVERTTKLRGLLAQLVSEIQHHTGEMTVSTNGNHQEVLLDVTTNGVRYTLIRSPVQSSVPEVKLTPREIEVVRLVMEGLSNRAIALVLDISPWTVATHLRRVYNKLDVNSRAEMVACAINHNLLIG